MKRNKSVSFLFILMIGLSACNLPFGQEPAQDVPDTGPDIQPPVQVVASNTPEFTLTPSNTPLPTFTFTPTIPMVSVSVETNCRTGPGEPYDIVGVLHVGESAEVVGQAPYGGSWIIKNPDGTGTCWLWDQYATVIGDWHGLPIFDIPPTPTPAVSFNADYYAIENCGGSWGIKLQITNNGSLTWESNRVIATDNVTSVTHSTITMNDFRNINVVGCFLVSADLNLEAGEVGFSTTAEFYANPAGHSFTATIRVCSLDGLAGTCLDKTITFTP
ncbi:MAG: hypothetical protein HY781_02380 [Chloroflexi bacterium]|nr:hypothetical protein [Chloroflexota bacterium]